MGMYHVAHGGVDYTEWSEVDFQSGTTHDTVHRLPVILPRVTRTLS